MLITHLEMVMAARIRREFHREGVQDALLLLSDTRRGCVEKKLGELGKRKLDLDPIECTDFCDKRDILRRHLNKPRSFERDLKKIESLRNALAHAGTYLSDDVGLDEFLTALRLSRRYTDEFRGGPPQSNGTASPEP